MLTVGRHGQEPEARMAVLVVRHRLGVDVVTVALPHGLGRIVAAKGDVHTRSSSSCDSSVAESLVLE